MTDDDRARARRAAAMRLHPDRGGDPDEFDRAMKGFERDASASDPAGPPGRAFTSVPRTRGSRTVKAIRTTSKAVVADVRRRLPRSFPGSRRYGHL